jgi:hypothetical protein
MEVVGDQRPCVTNALAFFQHTPETPKELLSIAIVPENLPTLNPPADDVLQRTRCVDARSSWHEPSRITGHKQNKVIFSAPLYILKREVNLWKYSRAGKNYRVEKAVTS